MQNFEQKGYEREEVLDVILSRGQSRVVDYRFELIDKTTKVKITDLREVQSASLTFDSGSEIKRTAKISTSQSYYTTLSYATWADIGNLTWNGLG